jgi:hypothetical protein
MNRNALQGLLAIGIFVGGGGLFLAFFQPQDSPEFVVSLCSVSIGLALIGLALILNRLFR